MPVCPPTRAVTEIARESYVAARLCWAVALCALAGFSGTRPAGGLVPVGSVLRRPTGAGLGENHVGTPIMAFAPLQILLRDDGTNG